MKDNILFDFYDIESLGNVFTLANHKEADNHIDMYFLIDNLQSILPAGMQPDAVKDYIMNRIRSVNKSFDGTVTFYDMHMYNTIIRMINEFGFNTANKRNGTENLFATFPGYVPFVNDFDEGYSDAVYPYLIGYNSKNYDITMLTIALWECFVDQRCNPNASCLQNNIGNGFLFQPPAASLLRQYNNEMFASENNLVKDKKGRTQGGMKDYIRNKFGWNSMQQNIRSNMLFSGRHLDAACLNEGQVKVALKKILGMLGYQIKESDKLKGDGENITIHNLDELAELFAYNCHDVLGLKYLFHHKSYYSKFKLKRKLLQTYPDLIYQQQIQKDENGNDMYDDFGEPVLTYKPDINPNRIKPNRLHIDDTSSKFAQSTLCPYGHLDDIPCVSFLYPSARKAKEMGIPQINVLEEARKFFYNLYPQEELRRQFDNRVYYFYKNIEGKNFNNSENYMAKYNMKYRQIYGTDIPVYDLKEIADKWFTLMHYFDRNGQPSGCYALFSTGGIHGAEYNKALYDDDVRRYHEQIYDLHLAQKEFANPADFKRAKSWTSPVSGISYKPSSFLKTGATLSKAEWKEENKLPIKIPSLFDTAKNTLNKRYSFTSIALTNHEDFTSYYPNLLIAMDAFYNQGLGYDRYAEIFGLKEKYGKLMKDKTRSEEERDEFSILREGTKLILNGASGAGDTAYTNPIQMNNAIISMRIIGQLFTWRIGQAQTYAGAKIISTNTDGLYSVMEADENAKILEREAKAIYVAIKPEPCYLVSKDTNNRLEEDESHNLLATNGGSLCCSNGPRTDKSLNHPAIIDWAICEYLRNADNVHGRHSTDYISRPFDRAAAMKIFDKAFRTFDKPELLRMFQTMLCHRVGSYAYIYGKTLKDGTIVQHQHYNKGFFVKDTTPNPYVQTISEVSFSTISKDVQSKRIKNNERTIQHDPDALALLAKYGVTSPPPNREATFKKITKIDPYQPILIDNRGYMDMTDAEMDNIIMYLDIDAYIKLVQDDFEKNWRNQMPAAAGTAA